MIRRSPMALLLGAALHGIAGLFSRGGAAPLEHHRPGKHGGGRVTKARQGQRRRGRSDHAKHGRTFWVRTGKRAAREARESCALAIYNAHRMCRLPRKHEQASVRNYRWRGAWFV